MKFTKEIFNEMEKDGKFYIDDLPIDNSDSELMFKIFSLLDDHDKYLALEWGFNDTVFRDNVLVFLIKNLFNMTVEEYYKSDIAKNYFENHVYIDFSYLN